MRNLLAGALAIGCISVLPAQAFNADEHREIGDEALKLAVKNFKRRHPRASAGLFKPRRLLRNDLTIAAAAGKCSAKRGDVWFSFGDLVAIYGDHAATFGDMNHRLMCGRAKNLKLITAGIARTSQFRSEQKIMIKLATNNPKHFSYDAARTYRSFHRNALKEAGKPGGLWRALHYEAEALHSFSDLFAFGHMNDNRRLSNDLVQASKSDNFGVRTLAKVKGFFADKAAKVLGAQTNFYHNAHNWRGAMLSNIAGDTWKGYGDGKYRVLDAKCAAKSRRRQRQCEGTWQQREVIVRAAAKSIREVLDVAANKRREKNIKTYAAMCHLPLKFARAHWPVNELKQLNNIRKLANAMEDEGRPLIDNGFDFSKGILKYERKARKGTVDYARYVEKRCGQRLR